MEPQSNNHNQLPKQNLEKLPKSPEVAGMSEQAKKLEGVPLSSLEQMGGDTTHERASGSVDGLQAGASSVATTLPTMPVPSDDSTQVSTQAPISAADDDVIEKEWVNKAKTIERTTKGDPYAKEREVSKLQADYLQKRYGKQVRMPDDTQ